MAFLTKSPNVQSEGRDRGAPTKRGCAGLFFGAMLLCAVAWGASLGAFVWVLDDTKSTIQALETFRPKVGSKVYSADGELLGEFSIEQRQLVSLSEIPLHLQRAFLATEDATFYEHHGVRPLAFASAFVDYLKSGRGRGASTITMQLVRNIEPLGVGQERSIKRKLHEAIVAFQVERDFTKDEILELYLNQIFLGISAHGVEAASEQYFGKHCRDLTLGESATLAGLTRSPNRNQPFKYPENALARRNIVLQQMLDNKFITAEEYQSALAETLEDSVVTPEEMAQREAQGKEGIWTPNKFKAPYFVEEIRQSILAQSDRAQVFEAGLEIHTTLDMRLQRAAETYLLKALDEFDAKKRESLKRQGKEDEFTPVAGALVCIDNRPGYRGYVRALVGGRDFENEKYNTATQARRQPGSSVKPFVWATAIASGMTPSDIIVDEPYERVDAWGNVWRPQNFGATYAGPITLRNALQKSINIVSVKLVERLTMPRVRTCLERAGIRTPIANAVGLTIALGTPEVTVLDQCVAYSIFPNGGWRYDPAMITEVRNRDGVAVPGFVKPVSREEAIPANVAYVMAYLMQGVCRFGTAANTQAQWEKAEPGRPRAGKTGTTNESRNAWFCGYTPDFTCVVWVGYRDNRSLGQGKDFTGGRLANPAWTNFMIAAEEGLPVRDFDVPDGVTFFDIDRNTGRAGGSFREAFITGTAPLREAPMFMEPSPETESSEFPDEAPSDQAPPPPNPEPPTESRTVTFDNL